MLRANETYWLCTDRDCGKTAACDETEQELEARVCECGSLMRREVHARVFSYLNFLRDREINETGKSKEEEEKSCAR